MRVLLPLCGARHGSAVSDDMAAHEGRGVISGVSQQRGRPDQESGSLLREKSSINGPSRCTHFSDEREAISLGGLDTGAEHAPK